uniref:E3 ubiquitin protein ligase n=1 Tax=Panagrellus redivivus TaxID=6233 RepID=A0A7E4W687_PANRE
MSDGSSADGVTSEPTTLSPSPEPLFPPDSSDDTEDDVPGPSRSRLHFFDGVLHPKNVKRYAVPVSASRSPKRSESRSDSSKPSSSEPSEKPKTNGTSRKVNGSPGSSTSSAFENCNSNDVKPSAFLHNNVKKIDEPKPSCSNDVEMRSVSPPTNSNHVKRSKVKIEPISSSDEATSSHRSSPSSSSSSPDPATPRTKRVLRYLQQRADIGTKQHPGDRYIYFEDSPYISNPHGLDYSPKNALNLPTIDKAFKPVDRSEIAPKYKTIRKTFKKLMQTREQRRREWQAHRYNLKTLEELIPTFASFLRMIDEEFRFIAENVLHMKVTDNLPKEVENRDKILKYLTRDGYGLGLVPSFERYAEFVKELSEKIRVKQAEMILEVMALYRVFAKKEFELLVKFAPDVLTEATGKSIEEILDVTNLSEDQLKDAIINWVRKVKEFNEACPNRKPVDPATIIPQLKKLAGRGSVLMKAMISDKAQLRLTYSEFNTVMGGFDDLDYRPRYHSPLPNEHAYDFYDNEASARLQERRDTVDPDHKIAHAAVSAENAEVDYHSLERNGKWYQHFSLTREFDLISPPPEKDPTRTKLTGIRKEGAKAEEIVEGVMMELRRRRRMGVRLKRLVSDMKKRNASKRQAMETYDSEDIEVEEEPDDGTDDEAANAKKINALKSESARIYEEIAFYTENINDLKESMKVIQMEIAHMKSEATDPDAIDPMSIPEVVQNKTELTKLCYDIKIMNRGSKVLDIYAKTISDVKKTLKAHIIAEEAEILTTLQTIEDNDTKELEELRRRNEEDKAEIATLDALPDQFENLDAMLEDLAQEDDRCHALNDKFEEDEDEVDQAIIETEKALDNITKDFDSHIRVELNFAPVKNLPIMDTELDDFDVQLIFGAAKHYAMADIDKNGDQLDSKDFADLIMKESARNDAEALEAVRLKQVLLYLNHATPEEKRVLYTQEAERRVRFTRHAHERAKEMNNMAQSVFTAHTADDEKLAEMYGSILDWKSRIQDATRAQEERNSRFLEILLNDVTKVKKAREIESELEVEHKAIVEELEEVAKVMSEDPLTAAKAKSKGKAIGVTYYENIEAELELNSLENELAELETLAQIEQKRITEMQECVDEKSHEASKIDKKLTQTVEEVDELKRRQPREPRQDYAPAVVKSKDPNSKEFVTWDITRLQALLKCSNCMQRNKSAIITKCNHLFCMDCITNLVRARNRKCPKCKEGFGNTDYRAVDLIPQEELEKKIKKERAEGKFDRESS